MATDKPMHRGLRALLQWRASGRFVLWIGVWLGLLYGTLSLANVSSSMSSVLCGPWGCTAPLEAVVACHLGWIVLLSPLGIAIQRRGTTRQRWLTGISLLAFSFTTILVLCGLAISESVMIAGTPKYIPHRIGLKIIGCVDLPIFATSIWGILCLLSARNSAESHPERQVTRRALFFETEQ